MAGSEKMGYENSRADLFEGASVIITPHARNSEADVRAIAGFWEPMGARTTVVSPAEHDLIAAYTSHLPHLAASSLVRVFDEFRQRPRRRCRAFRRQGLQGHDAAFVRLA